MVNRQALFRFDINKKCGGGHFIRCTQLALALRARGWVTIAAVSKDTTDLTMLRTSSLAQFPGEVLQIDTVNDRLPAPKGGERYDLVVVDSYDLIGPFRHLIPSGAGKLMRMVDWPQPVHDADVVVDVSSGSSPVDYQSYAAPGCALLLGSNYAIQAPEFLELRSAAVAKNKFSKKTSGLEVFVSFGLGDTVTLCAASLRALEATRELTGSVHVALSAQSSDALTAVGQTSGLQDGALSENIELYPDCDHVAALMASADIAIGACGMSSWERCCLGLPAVACSLSRDQDANAERLERAGAILRIAYSEGDIPEFEARLGEAFRGLAGDPPRRAAMSQAAAKVIDGRGVERIIARLD